jgi:hypothetical protein
MTKIEVGKTYKFRLLSTSNENAIIIFVGKKEDNYVFMCYREVAYEADVNIIHLVNFRQSSFVTAKVLEIRDEINWIMVDPNSVVFSDD